MLIPLDGFNERIVPIQCLSFFQIMKPIVPGIENKNIFFAVANQF
jgi:hypothetical protein